MKHLLLLTFACAAMTVNAQKEFTVGNLTYTVTSPTTVELTKLDSKVKDAVEIPEKVTNADGSLYTVTSIGEEACKWSDAVSITLPETVDSIKKAAFSSSKITSITLPKNLRFIGSYAFSSSKLTSVDVPATVEVISDHAFFGTSSNPSLTSVKLHEGLKKIGDGAFYSSGLTEIEIPASVTTLGKSVFLRNRSLRKVVFHDGLLTIGQGAFNDCQALAEFTLPNTLKAIDDEAFFKAKAIKSLYIPKSLETIGSCAFAGTSLTSITIDADNKNFVLKDGVLYTKDFKVLQLAPLKGIRNYRVESACLGIAGGAFWGSELESITLPDNIVAIGYGAFLGSQLKSINWPKYLSYIDEQAFASTQFTELTLPSSVYYIADGSFASCKKLTKVTMPSGIMQVYAHAFHSCEHLSQFVAKGSTAPEFMSYYESYDAPFYGIASLATLIVPKGAIKSYTNAGWGDFFNIEEAETASLTVKSITPEKGSNFDKNAQFLFNITFNETLQLVNKNPEVQIRQDYFYSPVYINPTGTPQWAARLEGNNTLIVFGNDPDGFLDTFVAEEGKTYYVTIPAGIVKDNTGAVNDQMTITYYGPKGSTGIESLKGTSPAGDKIVARYNLNGQAVNAAQKGIQIVKYADGTIRKVVVK